MPINRYTCTGTVSSSNSQPSAAPPVSSSMSTMYGTLASIVTSSSGSSTLSAAGIQSTSSHGQPLSQLPSFAPNMLKPPPLPARRQVSHPVAEDTCTSHSHAAMLENAEGASRQETTVTESRSAPSSPVEQHRPFPLAPAIKSSALLPSQRPKSVFIHNNANYSDVLFTTEQAVRPVVHSSEASVGYSSVQLDPAGKGDLGKRQAATLVTFSEDWQTPESNYDVPPPPVPARTYNTKADIAAAATAMATVAVPPPILMMTILPGAQHSNPFGGGNAFSNVFVDQPDPEASGFEQMIHFSGREGNGKGASANCTREQNPFSPTGDPFNAKDPFEQMGKPNYAFDPFNTGVPNWDDPASFYDRPPPSSHMSSIDNDPKWGNICQSSSPLTSLASTHNGLSLSPPSAKPIEDSDCTGESYEDVANFIKEAQERDASLSNEAIFVPAASVFRVPTVEEVHLTTSVSPQETYDFPAALIRHPSWEVLNNAPAHEEECVAPALLSGRGSFESLQDQKHVFEGNGFRSHVLQQSEPSQQLQLPHPRQPDHPTNLVDHTPIPPVRYPDQLPALPSKGPYDQNPPVPAPRNNSGSLVSPVRPKSREETIVELCALGYTRNDVVRAMAIASNDCNLAKKILQEFGHR